ncbi:DUF788-domain-containing protein [Sistotremastrum niveocremeum HHB9708]|uniref:DUF788-domain-containing protein n=1 Tax=Sistotremastrum niveocremeum HHB9708 TaxID=1314777 RepID=A0A164ZS69_9AGAM|nr:DUF788-domain-containing protein [Sistotremastrum niveocremeum HHB9708]
MAGGSAKRTAAQNEAALKTLRISMLSCTAFSLVVRLFFIRRSWPPSFFSIVFLAVTHVPSTLLYNYLVNLGSPRRDQSGQLLGSGGDLSQSGLTEYAFDILYVTWACQIGSALFGNWVWWLFSVIPLFAGYKLWNLFGGGLPSFASNGGPDDNAANELEQTGMSKRQQKLQKRAERGDARVRAVKR